MKKVDEDEKNGASSKLLNDINSQKFVNFLESHYDGKTKKFNFYVFSKKYNIENIHKNILNIIVKLSKKDINSIFVSFLLTHLGHEDIKQLQPNQIKKFYADYFTPKQLTWFGSNIIHLSISNNDDFSYNIGYYVNENYQKDKINTNLLWLLTKINKNNIKRIDSLWIDILTKEQAQNFNYDQVLAFLIQEK